MPVEVRRTPAGAEVVVDGEVRATFVGDLEQPADRAALDELVRELFGGSGPAGAPVSDCPGVSGGSGGG